MTRGPVIPSLYTDDMDGTLAFYTGVLGFGRTGEWVEEDEFKWVELKHPGLRTSPDNHSPLVIWFFANALTGHDEPVMSGLTYFLIEGVDDYAAELTDKVDISWGPETQPYGLREVGLKDNNGYWLVFAEET